jgi:hypothetical protein
MNETNVFNRFYSQPLSSISSVSSHFERDNVSFSSSSSISSVELKENNLSTTKIISLSDLLQNTTISSTTIISESEKLHETMPSPKYTEELIDSTSKDVTKSIFSNDEQNDFTLLPSTKQEETIMKRDVSTQTPGVMETQTDPVVVIRVDQLRQYPALHGSDLHSYTQILNNQRKCETETFIHNLSDVSHPQSHDIVHPFVITALKSQTDSLADIHLSFFDKLSQIRSNFVKSRLVSIVSNDLSSASR